MSEALRAELPRPATPAPADTLPLLDRLERALDEAQGRALVLHVEAVRASGGASPVFANAEQMGPVAEWAGRGQRCLDRLERELPSVALMGGSWFGPLMEVALACRRRALPPRAGLRCGFWPPDAGPPPAWGGSVRLTRLLGPGLAFELLRSGAALDDEAACRLGLVQPLPRDVPPESLLETPAPRPRRPLAERLLEHLPGGRGLIVRTIERSAGDDAGAGQAAGLVRRAFTWPSAEALEAERALLDRLAARSSAAV